MSQCWAQEPDQRPSFHKIQDQLQLFKLCFLNSISQHQDEGATTGIINESFEGKLFASDFLFFPSSSVS